MASEDIFAENLTEAEFGENEIAEEYVESEDIMEDMEVESETEGTDDENLENIIPDEAHIASAEPNTNIEKEAKLLQLPLSRVRHLMKLDPELQLASNEAVFIVAKATQLFIESFAKEAFTYTTQAKKKTMQKRDIDLAIAGVDSLLFLDGALN